MSGAWGYGRILNIFISGYIVGGLTLLPAVLVLAWFWTTSPVDHEARSALERDASNGPDSSGDSAKSKDETDTSASLGLGLDEETLERLKSTTHVPDVCAGYFAVCRDYVPGGVNGKPPDRTTPAGAVISMESPSVYQSMYRSIFDRNKTVGPTIDAATKSKKARNVFYVVLRLGHLMLYDNEDQLEVRHVISLAHYKVDIYAGGGRIPEGELWIKRNCIRLRQRLESDTGTDTKAFCLFSDNCSEKEDFYHAMLQAQEHHKDRSDADPPPLPLKFDTSDLVKLVQQLHASEENLHTRWINALIGRVFLGLYKTSQVKDFIAAKINKKIARVPKPALISSVQLRKVDMGSLPPFITNPKLKELTVDGDLVVEADVSYKGNFRIEVSATVRIDLGTRFKAREVTLILATVLKKLDGHILIRIKPPPSNRLWFTFETPPRMELSLEPIVSSRQITYGVVLRAIESRIREVVNETLVYPNWDDMPFTDTTAQTIRGGIWSSEGKHHTNQDNTEHNDVILETAIEDAGTLDTKIESSRSRSSAHSTSELADLAIGISSASEWHASTIRPRPMRSNSAAALVKLDSAHASAEILQDRATLTPTSVRSLPITSPTKSPLQPEIEGPAMDSSNSSSDDVSAASASIAGSRVAPRPDVDPTHARSRSKELTAQEIAVAAAAAAEAANMPKKQTINRTLNSASVAARNWLISKHNARTNNSPGRNSTANNQGIDPSERYGQEGDGTHDTHPQSQAQPSVSKAHTEPMGRGQPLPPPGTPLPPPKTDKRQTWAMPAAASTFANLAKRKPVPAALGGAGKLSQEQLDLSKKSSPLQSQAQYRNTHESQHTTPDEEDVFRKKMSDPADSAVDRRRKSSAASSTNSVLPPPLPKRRQRQPSVNLVSHQRRTSQNQASDHAYEEGVLVVEAPLAEGSTPSSPLDDNGARFRQTLEGSSSRPTTSDTDVSREEGLKLDQPL